MSGQVQRGECSLVDERGSGLYDESVVLVNDPVKDDHECPVCEVAPGEQCVDDKGQLRGTHRKRREGRTRRDIERAEAEARAAHERAQAAERWEREIATPPTLGAVLEVKRWKWTETGFEFRHVPDGVDLYIVEETYANRTVRAAAQDGAKVFLSAQRPKRRLECDLRSADIGAPTLQERRRHPLPNSAQGWTDHARSKTMGLTDVRLWKRPVDIDQLARMLAPALAPAPR